MKFYVRLLKAKKTEKGISPMYLYFGFHRNEEAVVDILWKKTILIYYDPFMQAEMSIFKALLMWIPYIDNFQDWKIKKT